MFLFRVRVPHGDLTNHQRLEAMAVAIADAVLEPLLPEPKVRTRRLTLDRCKVLHALPAHGG